ncbi:hypothetical protein SVAN01_10179 [Stagonosporopsis vannaccii]|nr:hypothetical protein SVAN01_10179 [Stagonosporopsis vannaccii]
MIQPSPDSPACRHGEDPACSIHALPTNRHLQRALADAAQLSECPEVPAFSGLLDCSFLLEAWRLPHQICDLGTQHHRRHNDTAETHRHSRLALRQTSTAGHLSDSMCRRFETWHRLLSSIFSRLRLYRQRLPRA